MKATIEDFECYITEREAKLTRAVQKVKSKQELLDDEDAEALLPYLKEFRRITRD